MDVGLRAHVRSQRQLTTPLPPLTQTHSGKYRSHGNQPANIMKTYNLFISHSWLYGNQYARIHRLLRDRRYFAFRDYSVPQDDPIHGAANDAQLRRAIKSHMTPCHVVLILAGVYVTYSRWINTEIDLAQKGFKRPKPIIAIRPRGNKRISQRVQNAADRIVGWNTESIVAAIRELG